ncbi:MAG: Arm DNA-binding domain-containing protein, partial [Casimicrobiaceae bacterium]
MPLTDTKIRNAKQRDVPYKLADSHGLLVEIRPTGSKLWRY